MSGQRWREAGLVSIGLIALFGGLVLLVVVLVTQGVDRASRWASVLGTAVAIAGAVITLVTYRRRYGSRHVPVTLEQLGEARELLASLVGAQWRAEERLRALGDPAPMPVRWTLTERPVADHARLIAPNALVLACRSDRIKELVEKFGALSRRRLVILGGPGSGKTTLAVQLLLGLLGTRAPAEPVPVLLTLAGWDLAAHPVLQDWVAARLSEDYPALRALDVAIPRVLVDQGMVVPVLDGLDELPEGYRPQVLTALNASLGPTDPVVVTCRTDDFAAAVETGDVLTAAAVIEPEPLTATDAADYLASCLPPNTGQPWAAVLQALRQDATGSLAAACATPLGLWLLRTVYITTRRDPRPLINDSVLFPDATAIEDHLLEELIPAVVMARPPSDRPADMLRPRHYWDPTDVHRWMGYLARHQHGNRALLWWHLPQRTFTPHTIRLIGSVVGALVGILTFGLMFGLVSGLVFGLMSGLIGGRQAACGFAREPGYASLRLRGRFSTFAQSARHVVRTDPLLGLAGSLAFGLAVGLAFGLVVGLMAVLVSLLVGGLGGGLARWAEVPSTADRAGTPISTHHADRALFIARVALGVLVGVLVGGPVFTLVSGVVNGLLLGLLLGLMLGLAAGGSRAWLSYTVAARWLAFTRRLPWRLLTFLDDAYRLGLLRIAGTAYQFRHAKLQDHLAAGWHPSRKRAVASTARLHGPLGPLG